MLEVKNVDISLSTRYLVKSLSFTLGVGDKLAIIGEEGNGKTTLLKAILGLCDYVTVTGSIILNGAKVGYLAQSMDENLESKSVSEVLFIGEDDYYDKISKFYRYLESFGLDDSILKQKMSTLSGGENVKIRILKLLLDEDDILVLDEPTNDLDIETLEWLEKFILETDKPLMYVSHDETLLSRTANMILHLEQIDNKSDCRHTLMRIDYDTYVENRLRSLAKQTQVAKSERREFDKKREKLQQILNKVEYQQKTISRSDPHGARLLKKKMHSLKSQEKKLENTELTNLPDVEESISFSFEDVYVPRNKIILNLDISELAVQDKVLIRNLKLDVVGNMHACIIGKNGVGKTTLIKKIWEELKGRDNIKVGYMPQNYDDVLANYEYVLDFISVSKSKEDITKARTFLSNMNFTKEETTGKISELSNGTKAKLILMKLVLEKCEVLILDEPTRNVSPLSNPVIRNVLKNFKGTIVSVSHDRKYIEEVADVVYLLDGNGLTKVL